MTIADLKRSLPTGTRLRVTNHYVTREDHPCYGTRDVEVTRTSSNAFVLDGGGCIPWPRADQLTMNDDGSLTILGGGCAQEPDEPFLTLRLFEPAPEQMPGQLTLD